MSDTSSDVGQASVSSPFAALSELPLTAFAMSGAWAGAWQSAMFGALLAPYGSAGARETPARPQVATGSATYRISSWYRPPVPTLFGDYMQGSGAFVPSPAWTSFAMAFMPAASAFARAWTSPPAQAPFGMSPFAGSGANPWSAYWMAGALPSSVETTRTMQSDPWTAMALASFLPMLSRLILDAAEMQAKMMGSFAGAGRDVGQPRTDYSAGFVAYRTTGGHAIAQIAPFANAMLPAAVPLSAVIAALEIMANLAPATASFA